MTTKRLPMFTRTETALILRRHPRTVDSLRKRGELRATRIGAGVFFTADAIEKLLKNGIDKPARTSRK